MEIGRHIPVQTLTVDIAYLIGRQPPLVPCLDDALNNGRVDSQKQTAGLRGVNPEPLAQRLGRAAASAKAGDGHQSQPTTLERG